MRKTRNRKKTLIAQLAANLNDVPLLFPPLKRIAVGLAKLGGYVYTLVQAWKHLF